MNTDAPENDNPAAMPLAEGGKVDLRDVPLDVTVELGRARLPLARVLEIVPGAVIELEKVAGAPLDVLFNGRLVARGEAVVVGERFGVRITSIVSTRNRGGTTAREG